MLTVNPIFHAQTKHVEVQHHFIRDAVKREEVEVKYIHTTKNLSDMLTKSLPAKTQKRHCKELVLG